MKDWLIAKTVPGLLNDRVLKPYGELTAFKFDSRDSFVPDGTSHVPSLRPQR